MKLKFTKMHGLGNDFVLLDGIRGRLPPVKKMAKKLCDRRFGIGCDQLLVLEKSRRADFKMAIFNADGSQVEMCGNGLRCLAHYIHAKKLSRNKVFTIETLKGIQVARLMSGDQVEIDMGEPCLEAEEIPVKLTGQVLNHALWVEDREFRVTCLSMGNPHCVIFVEELDDFPFEKYGPLLEHHPLFPNRVNAEFVQVHSSSAVEMRVWERGAGETLACGSGACAVAVAAHLNHLVGRQVAVQLKGGVLKIHWNQENNHVLMTGPAALVYEGVIDV